MLFYLGEYTFPDDDWKNVTQTAKDLIRSMLTVDVNKRIDIDVFMRSPWIALPNEVPTTPLGYFLFQKIPEISKHYPKNPLKKDTFLVFSNNMIQ